MSWARFSAAVRTETDRSTLWDAPGCAQRDNDKQRRNLRPSVQAHAGQSKRQGWDSKKGRTSHQKQLACNDAEKDARCNGAYADDHIFEKYHLVKLAIRHAMHEQNAELALARL